MDNLSLIIEALLFSSSRPLNEKEIMSAFELRSPPSSREIKDALKAIEEKYSGNSIELVKVASGYRLRIRQVQNCGRLNHKNTLALFWRLSH